VRIVAIRGWARGRLWRWEDYGLAEEVIVVFLLIRVAGRLMGLLVLDASVTWLNAEAMLGRCYVVAGRCIEV
jgi:hypothetical protein